MYSPLSVWHVQEVVVSVCGVKGYITNTTTTTTTFNSLFSRTNLVSRYQKGRTILDFNEARDDGVAVASAVSYANHLHLVSDR